MAKAVIVGGTGQIGHAVAGSLVSDGWDVVVTSRQTSPVVSGCRHVKADASDADALKKAVGSDTDLLLSCVAFDSEDAECLASAGADAGRIVSISSASVYMDDDGRTLDEAGTEGFPNFPMPLTEKCRTVQPSGETYSTRKVDMERTLIKRAVCPVTVLRPCAIHGPYSKHAREWWFVKRILDGRKVIPLAYRGESRFQTTSVSAIANAVRAAHHGRLGEVENVSDGDSPSVADIGRSIIEIMNADAELVGLPDTPSFPPELGATPWSVPKPVVCSSAIPSGYAYAEAVRPAISWLVETVPQDAWQDALPQLAAYPNDHFDYDADERALRFAGTAL